MANEPGWPALLAGAMASARESGDVDTELLAANNLITANESSGDPRAARALAAQMVARASSLSLIGWEIQFRAMRLNLDLHAADYLPAIAEAIELLDEPIDARARAQVETSLAFCLIDVGRVDLAARRLTELETDPLGEVIGVSTIRWLQAEAELNGGRPRRARDLAREAMADASVPGFPRIVERLAVWELGEDAGAALGEDGTPLLAGIHPESIGLLAATRGKALEAVAAFDEAAVLWAPYHRRGALRCRWLAAELARAADDVSSSRERLLELEPELIERGMTPLLRRVHRSLRAVGERRTASRGPSPAGELSARQREVMGLVASGLTNGEIARRLGISRATVVEQVGAAMALLGASTRGQAAVLATS
jgi:DNA-binding CsgD family transcriptional regulator